MPNPTESLTAVQECAQARERILGEVRKVIVGQERVVDELLDRPLLRRALPAGRRAGAGQDPPDLDARPGARPQVQPHPVHARPDAVGHHRDRDPRGGPRDRAARVQVRPRAGLRQPDPGRRDQPHPAQDPGGAAAGDAGEGGHRGRRDVHAGAAVLRAGDPEPDRAGGNLSPSRGAARPIHVPHLGRLSRARRRRSGSSRRRPAHRRTR